MPVVLILIIVFLSGCQLRGGAVETERDVEMIHKGTQGLGMSFANGMPPDRIYDTSTLDMLVELKNLGTADLDVSNCMLYLSGYDRSIVLFDVERQACGNLDGKSVFTPEGSIGTAEFNADTILLPYGVDSYSPNFLITACYKYKTIATPVVCVDPNLYSLSPVQRACVVKDETLSGGQGAPVSVDKVEVDMLKDNVLFKIYISNSGAATTTKTILGTKTTTTGKTGIVLSDAVSPVHECPYNLEYDDYNVVRYYVDAGTISLVECTPNTPEPGTVRLIDNKAVIYCKFDTGMLQSATQIPLTIELDYGYMDYVSKKVEIIKTP